VSNYADKHPHGAQCADTRCNEPGTVLKFWGGQLDWWCEWHAQAIESNQARERMSR
jgi:hypothetical protein